MTNEHEWSPEARAALDAAQARAAGGPKLVEQSTAWTMAKPTMQLRWVPKSMLQAADLKLQQAWETVHYDGARPVRIETEWRDVPVVRE